MHRIDLITKWEKEVVRIKTRRINRFAKSIKGINHDSELLETISAILIDVKDLTEI